MIKFRVFFISILFCLLFPIYAQKSLSSEVGISANISSYAGDVGGGLRMYNPLDNMGFGVRYKKFKNNYISYRLDVNFINFVANDYTSENTALKTRGYNIFNSLLEVFAGGEFNFFEFTPYSTYNKNRFLTPYISSGIAIILYQPRLKKKNEEGLSIEDFDMSFSLPVIFGVKSKITNRMSLFMEGKAAYTFENDLDYSPYSNGNNSVKENLNDWYFALDIGITYTLKKYKCFCLPPIVKEVKILEGEEKIDEETDVEDKEKTDGEADVEEETDGEGKEKTDGEADVNEYDKKIDVSEDKATRRKKRKNARKNRRKK